jgi:hypothetical protein
VVLACSALKHAYQEYLRHDVVGQVHYVHLRGSEALIAARLAGRKGHFMSPSLLHSQFETLEPPGDALQIDITPAPEVIAAEIRRRLGLQRCAFTTRSLLRLVARCHEYPEKERAGNGPGAVYPDSGAGPGPRWRWPGGSGRVIQTRSRASRRPHCGRRGVGQKRTPALCGGAQRGQRRQADRLLVPPLAAPAGPRQPIRHLAPELPDFKPTRKSLTCSLIRMGVVAGKMP